MNRGTMKGLWISGNKFLSEDGKEYTVYPMNYVKYEKSDFPMEVFINFEIYRDKSSKKENILTIYSYTKLSEFDSILGDMTT